MCEKGMITIEQKRKNTIRWIWDIVVPMIGALLALAVGFVLGFGIEGFLSAMQEENLELVISLCTGSVVAFGVLTVRLNCPHIKNALIRAGVFCAIVSIALLFGIVLLNSGWVHHMPDAVEQSLSLWKLLAPLCYVGPVLGVMVYGFQDMRIKRRQKCEAIFEELERREQQEQNDQ